MASETVADICAEKRRTADNIEASAKGEPNQFQRELIASLRDEADRIEAAHKREVGVSKTETTTEDATVEGAVRNILGYVETARQHTEDAHMLGYLDQIAQWARALTMGVAENATTTGDGAKCREALVQICDYLKPVLTWKVPNDDRPLSALFAVADTVHKKAKAALAAPRLNCEVGTAKEQTERFKGLCRKYRRGSGPRANCKGCPIEHESLHVGCTFAWAQMPYEEGGES